jgi:hypothetical protein
MPVIRRVISKAERGEFGTPVPVFPSGPTQTGFPMREKSAGLIARPAEINLFLSFDNRKFIT